MPVHMFILLIENLKRAVDEIDSDVNVCRTSMTSAV